MSFNPITAAQGSDGYVTFFTGANGLAGDNDLFYNRATGDLILGGGGKLGLGTVPSTKLHISGGNVRIVPTAYNDATTPALAFGDGDTGFYETSDDWFALSVGATPHSRWKSGLYESLINGGFTITTAVPSATVPNFRPNGTDADTGIGYAGTDQLSLISGGLEGIRVSETTGDITATVYGTIELEEQPVQPTQTTGFGTLHAHDDGYLYYTNADGYQNISGPCMAEMWISTPVATTIGTGGVFAKAAGTTEPGELTQDFIVTSSNRVVYTGGTGTFVKVSAALSFTSDTALTDAQAGISHNGGGVLVKSVISNSLGLGTDQVAFSVQCIVYVMPGDYVELYVSADVSADITVEEMNFIVEKM